MTKNKEFLDNLEKHNAKLRIKFEKEAHDREREDIQITVDVYNKFVSNNALKQLL
jgi:hypothetical protein